jgi:hypothetical protein
LHDTDSGRGRFLTSIETAEWLRCSVRSVHELTRTLRVPHRRLPGQRRCLFVEEELTAWMNGVPLVVTELPEGGRIVRPEAGTDRPQRTAE